MKARSTGPLQLNASRLRRFLMPSHSSRLRVHFLGIFAAITFPLAGSAATLPDVEINALLQFVGGLKDEVFIRNGDAHPAKEAEAHLRLKWNNSRGRILTAEDFIRYCATKSSLSGKEYLIRFPDGREESSAQVLLKELQRIRARPPAAK